MLTHYVRRRPKSRLILQRHYWFADALRALSYPYSSITLAECYPMDANQARFRYRESRGVSDRLQTTCRIAKRNFDIVGEMVETPCKNARKEWILTNAACRARESIWLTRKCYKCKHAYCSLCAELLPSKERRNLPPLESLKVGERIKSPGIYESEKRRKSLRKSRCGSKTAKN